MLICELVMKWNTTVVDIVSDDIVRTMLFPHRHYILTSASLEMRLSALLFVENELEMKSKQVKKKKMKVTVTSLQVHT